MVETETLVKIIRVTNILAAIVVGACGLFSIITLKVFTEFHFLEMWSIFTPLFMLLFAAMLIGLELKNAILFEYCFFLVSFFGRGIFYIFLGSIASYQLSQVSGNGVGYIWGLILFLFGLLFIGFHFTSAGDKLNDLKQQVETNTAITS